MAHLMRRAGFGAPRDELEAYDAQGYGVTKCGILWPFTTRADGIARIAATASAR